MHENSEEPKEQADLTAVVTEQYFFIGVGESVDELRESREWIASDNPVDVRM